MANIRHHRAEAVVVDVKAGCRAAAVTNAVVRIATSQDPVTARIAVAVVVVARHLDRSFVTFRTTTGEVHLIDVVGGDAHEAIGECDRLIVAELPERGEVFKGLDLLGSDLSDLFTAVPDLREP